MKLKLTMGLLFVGLMGFSQDNYVLMLDGKKIPIDEKAVVSTGENNAIIYLANGEKIAFMGKKFEDKKIEKIVLRDELYLPFQVKKKTRLLEVIAQSEKYYLAKHLIIGPSMDIYYYMVFDKDRKTLIAEGRLDKKEKEKKKAIADINKYFGDCEALQQEYEAYPEGRTFDNGMYVRFLTDTHNISCN